MVHHQDGVATKAEERRRSGGGATSEKLRLRVEELTFERVRLAFVIGRYWSFRMPYLVSSRNVVKRSRQLCVVMKDELK